MAMSVNPAIEGNQPLSSGHCDPAAMIRPRSTVPIRARGHVVPHQQAAHMTATGRTLHAREKLLRAGGHPHMTVGEIFCKFLIHGTSTRTGALDKMTPSADIAPDDLIQPFQIEPFALRGRLVRLGPTIDRILSQHAYPEPVAAMLGEAITLAVVLAGALKYEGIFTLQTKGDGPIRMMVADVSTEGALRGYAQYDEAKLEAALAHAR